PAIAMSQVCQNGRQIHWTVAEQHAADLVSRLVTDDWPSDLLININFPDIDPAAVRGYKVTTQGKRKLGDELLERVDPRGEPYVWIGGLRIDEAFQEGTDLHAVTEGYVSITPIHMDMTHRPSFARLRQALS
ncbi:MAG: 5'/3'-nucleotidase SurE, partial [Geminicoccaceae bacterium]|nr:5'/3'-nucleotidase SurE [Geminicoccaceae bacterium]